MSKVLVENPVDQTQVPFLRGILVHSLQDAGLDFKQAHHLASEIRTELDNHDIITTMELQQRVAKKLARLVNPAYLHRYENRVLPLLIKVESRNGQISEFLPTAYRNKLEAIGLRPGEALAIVAAVSEHLLKRNIRQVTSKYIAYFTYRLLRKSKNLGPAVARRWLIWRDFIDSGKPLVLLVAGSPGSGKSTVAADLASRLDIVRTQSTDLLREVMRSFISEQVQPLLHQSSFAAWDALPEFRKRHADRDELLIEGFTTQAVLLSTAIEAVIQRAVREGVSLVVEGVHLEPGRIAELRQIDDALVVPVILAVLKPTTLRNRITGRSADVPQRRVKHYLEHFDSIWKLQSYLLSEADHAGVPIIINEDREHVFREIMLYIISTLEQTFDKSPEQVFA